MQPKIRNPKAEVQEKAEIRKPSLLGAANERANGIDYENENEEEARVGFAVLRLPKLTVSLRI